MQKPNLSQSLLKEYLDYYDENVKGCGLALHKKYFQKLPTPQSDTQRLGVYFEYKCTGYIREGDPIPEPELVYKGTPKEKMAVDYERATKSAELFKKMLKDHNINVIKYGEYMSHNGVSGISDIRANWNGEECIIDIKYTSLFDDKFNEYGWHTESLVYKSKLLLQPIHYKYLMSQISGVENMPFYFFIFSAKDPEKAKIIKVNIQEEHINLHGSITIPKMLKYVDHHYKKPEALEARPSYLRCKECPFMDNCDKKTTVPLIEQIHY
jgi:hypothetical protein